MKLSAPALAAPIVSDFTQREVGFLPHGWEWRLGHAPMASSGRPIVSGRVSALGLHPNHSLQYLLSPTTVGEPSKQPLESLLTAFQTLPSLSHSCSTQPPQDNSNATLSEKPSLAPPSWQAPSSSCSWTLGPPSCMASPPSALVLLAHQSVGPWRTQSPCWLTCLTAGSA